MRNQTLPYAPHTMLSLTCAQIDKTQLNIWFSFFGCHPFNHLVHPSDSATYNTWLRPTAICQDSPNVKLWPTMIGWVKKKKKGLFTNVNTKLEWRRGSKPRSDVVFQTRGSDFPWLSLGPKNEMQCIVMGFLRSQQLVLWVPNSYDWDYVWLK